MSACSIFESKRDGISLWSNVAATLDSNYIFNNRCFGITCYSRRVRLLNNTVYANAAHHFPCDAFFSVMEGNRFLD